MLTIWALVHALTTGAENNSLTSENKIESIIHEKLKKIDENEYFRFFETTKSISLEDGLVISKIDFRSSKDNKKNYIMIEGINGCLKLSDMEKKWGELPFPKPPSHPYPDAMAVRTFQLNGKEVNLGFKMSNMECLNSIWMDL
ncbi:hypothetical protein ACFIQF_01760 [Comamonas sp. J-3]|uniref:hypothetical protein n=1 Tax=Comamonas trifloxystrobinivorans TaxID=3350256 RepID=UPI003728B9E5